MEAVGSTHCLYVHQKIASSYYIASAGVHGVPDVGNAWS